MELCSAPPLTPCAPSPPIPNTSAPRLASSPCSIVGARTYFRTLTHDAGHYHLLRFQRTNDADCLHCPPVISVCLSAAPDPRCFDPLRHPNPCADLPSGR